MVFCPSFSVTDISARWDYRYFGLMVFTNISALQDWRIGFKRFGWCGATAGRIEMESPEAMRNEMAEDLEWIAGISRPKNWYEKCNCKLMVEDQTVVW